MNTQENELLIEHLHGRLSPEKHAALNDLLRRDAEAREWLCTQSALETRLRVLAVEKAVESQMQSSAPSRSPSVRSRWPSWRPLAAAAAGLVFGMLCTSVVFAYVAPAREKTLTLLRDGFDSGDAPLPTGVPVLADRWSGDYTEVAEAQQGVTPESGKKMLRLLRADYAGKPDSERSAIADIYRLIDMRPYRQEFADGSAVVQFSAAFNAFAFAQGEAYQYKMSVHALDAQTATDGSLRVGSMRSERELASARTGRIRLDRNPATWQRAHGDLRVPGDTDFLLIRIALQAPPKWPAKTTFAGHYLDDVRLTLTHRSPLP